MVGFAGLTGDYYELHTSAEFAKHSEYGERIAHGLLGLTFAQGLMFSRTGDLDDCIVAFLGISDWQFTGPIRFGDTIHVQYAISELRPSNSRPDRAIATFDVDVLNQRDEVVQRGKKTLLLAR